MLTIHKDRDDITPALRELLGKLSDFSEPMAGIGQELEGRISARFETQTDPNGAAWHPWAASTRASYPFAGTKAAAKAGKVGNGRLLDRYSANGTGLLGTLNHQAGQTEVMVGFGVDYAVYHEYGTRKMPRRGLIFANPQIGILALEDEESIIDIINRWLA